ncbi:MAG: group 1 glycosyl transferase [Parcubacteria group bacterium Athens1014_10]|nr:MAG: group 1 glycosyl transferase [Parcubacteria group bacterium Athens1014_10]
MKFPDKIFAVSEEHQKVLQANKVRCDDFIYNGINNESFNCSGERQKIFLKKFNLENKKIILGAGRLHPAKGFECAIKALPNVCKKDKNIVFVLASQKNNYADYLLKLAAQMGVKDNFLITGWLEGDDLKSAFCASLLVVYPSLCFDTFGLVNLEAMAAKKPVIATCFGGSKEVVLDGITGYVINPYNTDDFSEKILKILKDEKLAKEMGQKGYQRVKEKFTIEQSASKYLENFKILINNKSNG